MKNQRGKRTVFSTTQALMVLPLLLSCSLLILTILTDQMTPAFLGTSLTIYLMGCAVFTAGRTRVSTVVRMYYNNQFYINCRDYMKTSLYKSLLVSAIFSFVLLVFGAPLSTILIGTSKGRLAFYTLSLCLVLTAAEAVLSGFVEGMGRKRTIVTYNLMQAVLATLFLSVLSLIGYRYGMKVDALLYTNDCAGAYAAFAGMAGIASAACIKLLMLVLSAWRILKKLSPLHETGKPKYLGEQSPYLKTVGAVMAAACMLPISILITSAWFVRCNQSEALQNLGIFYGRYLSYVMMFGFVCTLPFIRQAYRMTQVFADGETNPQAQNAGELFIVLLRKQTLLCFPMGTFLMALAPCLDSGIFLLKNETADVLMTYGGFVAALLPLSLTLSILLIRTRRSVPLLICALTGAIISVITTFLTIQVLSAGISGAVAALIVFGSVFCIMGIFMLKVVFGIRRAGVFRMMAKPLIMAALAAMAVFLLSSGLKYLIGEIPACVIGLFPGICLYLILLSIFGGIEADELRAIPGGSLLEKIAMRARNKTPRRNGEQ